MGYTCAQEATGEKTGVEEKEIVLILEQMETLNMSVSKVYCAIS